MLCARYTGSGTHRTRIEARISLEDHSGEAIAATWARTPSTTTSTAGEKPVTTTKGVSDPSPHRAQAVGDPPQHGAFRKRLPQNREQCDEHQRHDHNEEQLPHAREPMREPAGSWSSGRLVSNECLTMTHPKLTGASADFCETVDRIANGDRVLAALRSMNSLAHLAAEVEPEIALEALRRLVANHIGDPLAAYVAVHALAGVNSADADEVLGWALTSGHRGLAEHAAWSLSWRRPVVAAVPALVDLAKSGGFTQMMAELALEAWLMEMPDLIWHTGRPVPERMWSLATRVAHAHPRRSTVRPGLRIAQVLMQGRVDADLSAPGSGDGGGLITLQVGLTRELARHEQVSDVYLITRSLDDSSRLFEDSRQEVVPGGKIARIGFGGNRYIPAAEMWSHRPELERRLEELLVREGPFDALHLRFADVGTFAAARVASRLGTPIYFTLAPDPHAVISAAESVGSLKRANFGQVDLEQHYVFRVWLVEHMLEIAERIALLPRADQRVQFLELFDVDINEGSDRYHVVPEGVDTSVAEEARRQVRRIGSVEDAPPVLVELAGIIDGLDESRRSLPMIITAGRLNRVKGMDRVVAAWAGHSDIRDAYNLVVVGGDLDSPSVEERSVLDSIAGAVGDAHDGLILLGGRPHADVAVLMSAAAEGFLDIIAPGGIYVSGSEKEEFGLAIVEALAAGLPVVAPSAGGPATYVEHGFTGFLGDTTDVSTIVEGVRWAGAARTSEVRADAARRMVRRRYSLGEMADALVAVYQEGRVRRSSAS